MTDPVRRSSFVSGEVAPSVRARADLPFFLTALATCRNFIVEKHGGAKNRPGTRYLGDVKTDSEKVRLIPFIFSNTQAYVLEFGDQYVRFWIDSARVAAATGTHTAGTSTTVMTDSGAAFTVDALIGMTIRNLTDGSSGVITDNDATTITVSALAGGTDNDWDTNDEYEVIYEVATPWLEDDLFDLHYAQQNDVLTVVHPDYTPYELRRNSEADWDAVPFTVTRPVQPPTSVALDATYPPGNNYPGANDAAHPKQDWDWVVTSVDANGTESLPSDALVTTDAVIYSDKPRPKINWTAPTGGNTPESYNIYRGRDGIYGFVGTSKTTEFVDDAYIPDYSDSPPDGKDPFVEVLQESEAATAVSEPFDHTDVAADDTAIKNSGPASGTGSEEAFDDNYHFDFSLTLPVGSSITLDFEESVAGGGAFSVAASRTYFGFFVSGGDKVLNNVIVTINVDGAVADHEFKITIASSSGSPTLTRNALRYTANAAAGQDEVTYPSTVCYFEQRLLFGGFTRNLQQVRASKTGDFHNFDESSLGSKEDDAVDLTIASRSLDEIRALVPNKAVLIFTSAGEWVMGGVEGAPLTPTSFDLKPHSGYGSAKLAPLVIGAGTLFVADRSRSVRLLQFSPAEGTQVTDLSAIASHLVEGRTIVDWAYSDEPDRTVWMVLSDGDLLGLTLVPEHQVVAWHKHDTGLSGEFESVCAVPEGDETVVYVAVKRTVDGSTTRTVERFESREITDVRDGVFLDAALTFDGRHTAGTTTLTLTGGTDYEAGETGLTLTATGGTPFESGHVGNEYQLGTDGARVEVTAFSSTTVVTVKVITAVPSDDRATTTWARAPKSFSGLTHLANETVSVCADGNKHPDVAVDSSGNFTLTHAAAVVHAGIGYTSDLQTLELAISEGQLGKRKAIHRLTLQVESSRGAKWGPSLAKLTQWKQRVVSDGFGRPVTTTLSIEGATLSRYEREGSLFIHQDEPLPLRVLALTAELAHGG